MLSMFNFDSDKWDYFSSAAPKLSDCFTYSGLFLRGEKKKLVTVVS